MATLYYFAYGSNMSTPRLQARVPSAEPISRARLAQYQLRFHKESRVDASAKCDAFHTGRGRDSLIGVVFRIAAAERPALDAAEGLGRGYELKQLTLECDDGHCREVFLYVATAINPALRPYRWYREHVLRGAREAGLPHDYIAAIEAVTAVEDPEPQRTCRELAIYR